MLLETFCLFMEKKNEYDITVIEGNKVFHGTFVMKTLTSNYSGHYNE